MSRTFATAVRTIGAAALVAAAALSCPNPIDEELLLVVDDETDPVITVVSPSQNSLYRYAVDVTGTLEDYSGATGTERGYVRRLTFSVAGNPTLSRVYTFERDGSWSATPVDPTFGYDPATGAFSFSVDTAGLAGMQFLTFVLEDLNANDAQQVVTLLQDPIGPALTVSSPSNGSSWPLLMAVAGTAVNQSGATTGDRIARIEGRIAGIQHELDLALLTLQGDNRYHGDPGTPAENFWFEPSSGNFGDSFDLSGESGNLQLQVEVEDQRGMTTTQFLTLFDNNTGPEIVMDDATHPCPDMYSSDVTTALTILGWVDPANLKPGTTQYIVEAGWQLPATTFTPDGAGEFSFTFDPQVGDLSGKLTVHVYAKDNADRTTHETHFIFDDPDEPEDPGGSFAVASGATYANNIATSLTFSISDAKSGMGQMRFNNDGGTWSGWLPYGAPYAWTLAATNGIRTVNAQFSDQVGNMYSTNDTIFLDTVQPTVTFTVAGGAGYTQVRSVTLQVAASDPAPASGVTEMRFHNDGEGWTTWEVWAATKAWTLRDEDGSRTVYAEVRDAAGNVRSVSDSIVLDRGDPSVTTFTINDGDSWTGSRDVTLTIAASDATSSVTEMRFNNDGGAWSGWESFSGSKAWTIANTDGANRQVNVEVRDNAGNVGSGSDTIGLDRSNPSISSFDIDGGAGTTTDLDVILTITATDAPLGTPYQMRFSNDGSSWSSWEAYGTSRSWTLEAGGAGSRTVYIQVNDQVGHADSDSDGITYSPP